MRTNTLIYLSIAVLLGSFFITLGALNYFAAPAVVAVPAPSPASLGINTSKFPTIALRTPVSFADRENPGALVSGWSVPEAWGVWSVGPEANLGFIPQGIAGKALRLQLNCTVFIAPEHPRQKVEVWSADLKLGEAEVGQSGMISFPVPAGRLTEGAPAVITLKLPNAFAPKESPSLKNPDDRKLGIGLTVLRIIEG